MRSALLQLSSTDDPAENLAITAARIEAAVAEGAGFVLTPEVTNCVSASRTRQQAVLQQEKDDITLAGLRDLAARRGIWLSIGSLALKTGAADGRFANRSFLIGPAGDIVARYDKIHMFDVKLSSGEAYRESKNYRPGSEGILADLPWGRLGMTICYDMRFAYLYRSLAHAGAEYLVMPSAFTRPTGKAHWHVLLRARAIETGCYVFAAAQCGEHAGGRKTYGHSLIVAPWGEVLADGGEEPGFVIADVDSAAVTEARTRVPSLEHDREFTLQPPASAKLAAE